MVLFDKPHTIFH